MARGSIAQTHGGFAGSCLDEYGRQTQALSGWSLTEVSKLVESQKSWFLHSD